MVTGEMREVQARTLSELHLGLLGPSIRAEVGDTVNVVFRNTVRFPTTIHVHGLLYSKNGEGSPYNDGTTGEPFPQLHVVGFLCDHAFLVQIYLSDAHLQAARLFCRFGHQ